jgi:acetolactate synthase-1/2/3 large subunit
VFVEVPVDLLYPAKMVRDLYLKESGVLNARSFGARALKWYIRAHLFRQFRQPRLNLGLADRNMRRNRTRDNGDEVGEVASLLQRAKRPALVIGSQTMVNCADADSLARAVSTIGVPTWLGGAARGLLGPRSDIQFLHKRGAALKESDVAVVCGFPFDFRMSYGRAIGRAAKIVSVNLSKNELRKNRRPDLAIHMNAAEFLRELAPRMDGPKESWQEWFGVIRERESARNEEIEAQTVASDELIDPIRLFLKLEAKLSYDAVLVMDGGDFVATASYILRPRAPLRWLDPGVFGTLGVGGGFAVGASSVHPQSETWLIYGDGSCAYSLAEFDTFVRHGMAPIAVIGNDGSWAQIAREQVHMLGDDIGTVLNRSPYHLAAEGYGGVGLLLTEMDKIDDTLDEAKAIAKSGRPVCINVHIAASDFRKGSISM